jgi:RNA polymerase sigma-70 factor (ECF subfamily)
MEQAVWAVADLEVTLRSRFDAGDYDGTVALAIRRYGSELYSFVRGLTRDPVRADDVFAATCERMWRFLPSFRWDSTFRVWAYAIARNEFLREVSRLRPYAPLSEALGLCAADPLTATAALERELARDRFAWARAQLSADDHALLELRVERAMSWAEIARVFAGDDATAREAATLRKRFERLKMRLRELLADA